MKLPAPTREFIIVRKEKGRAFWGENVRTTLLDTGVVGRLHGGGDDRDEFPVDLFLLGIDGLSHRIREVFEYFLIYAQLLLEHMKPGDVRPIDASTGLDFAVEIFDRSTGVAGEAGRYCWGAA